MSAAHAGRIAPDAEVITTRAKITHESTAKLLLDADIVFGCTDDNAGRLVLSRIASYLLTPVVDCGVLLSSGPGGQLIGIDGRVTVLAPGDACLVCRNRIDLRRAAAEMLDPDEHRQLAEEGYAPGLLEPEPAVVTFTTQVASTPYASCLRDSFTTVLSPCLPKYCSERMSARFPQTTRILARVTIAIRGAQAWPWRHGTVPRANMAVWDKLSAWWRSLQVPWRRWRIIDQLDAGDEVPERLPNRGVVLVGPPGESSMGRLRLPMPFRA